MQTTQHAVNAAASTSAPPTLSRPAAAVVAPGTEAVEVAGGPSLLRALSQCTLDVTMRPKAAADVRLPNGQAEALPATGNAPGILNVRLVSLPRPLLRT
jgi:hypothetical protein